MDTYIETLRELAEFANSSKAERHILKDKCKKNVKDFFIHEKERVTQDTQNINKTAIESISNDIDKLLESIKNATGSQFPIYLAFLIGKNTGRYVNSIESNYSDLELSSALTKNFNRELPLKKENITRKILKELVQERADRLWKKEAYRDTRIADMCEIIYSSIYSTIITTIKNSDNDDTIKSSHEFLKKLPQEPKGLKSWLREIAPPEAQKRGAPKKNKCLPRT